MLQFEKGLVGDNITDDYINHQKSRDVATMQEISQQAVS